MNIDDLIGVGGFAIVALLVAMVSMIGAIFWCVMLDIWDEYLDADARAKRKRKAQAEKIWTDMAQRYPLSEYEAECIRKGIDIRPSVLGPDTSQAPIRPTL